MPTSITSVHSQNKFILQGTADRSPAEDKWRVVKACLAKHKVSLPKWAAADLCIKEKRIKIKS